MKVKDLMEILEKHNPDAEFVFYDSSVFGGYQTSNGFRFDVGYYVTDAIDFPYGCFVSRDLAFQVQNDGQMLLDLSSPTIVPALCLFKK